MQYVSGNAPQDSPFPDPVMSVSDDYDDDYDDEDI
jgi:hypothetical protein